MEIKELQVIAKELRKNIVEMIYRAKSGHPGGSLSIADILSVLYWKEMNVDPINPKSENRDRLVLSKGHAAPALYAALIEKGYVSKDLIPTLRKWHSPLQGHPDMKKLNGVEMSTGSLGQGLSVGNGMALSSKIFKNDYRVYVILGDGELQEGQVWEAAMTAAHYKLDNLVAIIDYNNLQIDGKVSDVMGVLPITDKFKSFNWNVIEIDGHSYEEIIEALNEARNLKGKPTAIIANTIKGKGISFMENNGAFHGAAPNDEQYKQAMEELK
ncbi:MAG: transketolase [Leptotrichiaceae bacterium]|mgnify:FL=1|nr:transketolase [Leptotrichiaceae bacterium]MBP6281010.1 transketolase [Leptotrichiaceae bacterium]MBP7100393.1 transketolase [Leptotrichiaceae bacterium]MBP7725004.1 transketolase [Leptotrichiaceae bacterium]MBP9629633.1 transketolase [Leptotrichiaceae bacterium]